MCTSAVESISLSEEGFAAARRGLRTSFLAQLERWKEEMSSHATEHTAGKVCTSIACYTIFITQACAFASVFVFVLKDTFRFAYNLYTGGGGAH